VYLLELGEVCLQVDSAFPTDNRVPILIFVGPYGSDDRPCKVIQKIFDTASKCQKTGDKVLIGVPVLEKI
jgi:hypothetical protein